MIYDWQPVLFAQADHFPPSQRNEFSGQGDTMSLFKRKKNLALDHTLCFMSSGQCCLALSKEKLKKGKNIAAMQSCLSH